MSRYMDYLESRWRVNPWEAESLRWSIYRYLQES